MTRLLLALALSALIAGGASAQFGPQPGPGPVPLPSDLTPTSITIAPAPSTIKQAIVSTQSSPVAGSVAGPLNYNRLSITHQVNVTGTGLTNGIPNQDTAGFRVDMFTGGGSTTNDNSFAGMFTNSQVNSGGVVTAIRGLVGYAYSNKTSGGLHGVDGVSTVDVGGVTDHFGGIEASAGICDGAGTDQWCPTTGTGGAANRRYAITLIGIGRAAASVTDTAIIVANNGTPGAAWNKLISLSQYGGQNPLSTTADFFYAEQAYTVANFANLPNVTVTGNILSFPNVTVTGAGAGTFTSLGVTALSSAVLSAGATISNATGVGHWTAVSSLGTNFISIREWEPANTQTAFGLTLGNWAGVFTNLAANNGLILGTITNVPVVFGTNNLERGRITGAGNVGFGLETNPQAPFVVSQNTKTALSLSANTVFGVVSADGSPPVFGLDGYGTGAGGTFLFRSARGTAASPSNLATNDVPGGFGVRVFTNGAFTAVTTARADFVYTDASPNNGTAITLNTTPNGSTTRAEAARVHGSGCLAVGTTTDCGIGKVTALNGYNVGATAGQSVTTTVRAAGGAADCTLVFTGGIKTGGTC